MKQVVFGSTGIKVSQMCLGTMMFGDRTDEAESGRIVDAALESGVNFFDTASMYAGGKTEEILGRLLKTRRDKVFLTTKVNVQNGADYTAQVSTSLDASLKRLNMDHVDLYLLHWPRENMNPLTIMEEMAKVVRAGKARFIGCSNFPAWLVAHFNAKAMEIGGPRLVNNQTPYNPIERGIEVEILPQAITENIAITCYRPLMAGVLTGKYVPGTPAPEDARAKVDTRIPNWLINHAAGVENLLALAKARNVPASNLALAWLRARRGVTCPIVGVSKLPQLLESIKAFEIDLTEAEQASISDPFASEVKEISQFFGPLRRKFGLTAE